MKKTVLFDFVNTLAYLSPAREDILQQFLQEKKEYILEAFRYTDEQLPYSSVNIINSIQKRAFYQDYNQKLFKNLSLICYNEFHDYYNGVKKEWFLYEDSLSTIEALKAKNISVGIISNFDKNLDEVLRSLGIDNLLDILIISAEIQLEKPNIEFYEYVKNNYNLDLDNTVYVGDSWSLDYEPSRSVGFESFIIDRNNLYLGMPNSIQNLSDIIEKISHVTQSI
tara:strand:+ start:2763 stop:3434 length:672 start_codon:yes stop_codon:yes gene_type:complete